MRTTLLVLVLALLAFAAIVAVQAEEATNSAVSESGYGCNECPPGCAVDCACPREAEGRHDIEYVRGRGEGRRHRAGRRHGRRSHGRRSHERRQRRHLVQARVVGEAEFQHDAALQEPQAHHQHHSFARHWQNNRPHAHTQRQHAGRTRRHYGNSFQARAHHARRPRHDENAFQAHHDRHHQPHRAGWFQQVNSHPQSQAVHQWARHPNFQHNKGHVLSGHTQHRRFHYQGHSIRAHHPRRRQNNLHPATVQPAAPAAAAGVQHPNPALQHVRGRVIVDRASEDKVWPSYHETFKQCGQKGRCHQAGMHCMGTYEPSTECAQSELCCNTQSLVHPTRPFDMTPQDTIQCGAGLAGECQMSTMPCSGHFQVGFCHAEGVECCMKAQNTTQSIAPGAIHVGATATRVCPIATKMANYALAHAASGSKGLCATYVRNYIRAFLPKYGITEYARDCGKLLTNAGFKVLSSGAALLPGDVRVIQPISGHPAGHIQMYTAHSGALWTSDFKQFDQWPGSQWRSNPSKVRYTTYRYSC